MSDIMWVGVVAAGMFGGVIGIAVIAKLREVRAAARWPSTIGKVINSKVQARRKRSGDEAGSVGNYPLVEYEYEVKGQTYTASRISIGEEAANSDVAQTLQRYPEGAGVIVYYNPDKPEQAVLERDLPPGLGLGLTILLFFLVGGPIGLALGYTVVVPKLAPHLPNPDRAPMVTVLCGMGLFALLIGHAIRKQARASRNWPAVEGLVLTSKVEPYEWRMKSGSPQTLYRANIVYAYEVDGHRYAGSRVSLGGVTGASSPKWAERKVQRYPEHAPVRVHYNPQNHAEALLEHQGGGGTVLVWIIAAVVFGVAYFVATR